MLAHAIHFNELMQQLRVHSLPYRDKQNKALLAGLGVQISPEVFLANNEYGKAEPATSMYVESLA